ncbi:unnamed protein product [Lasius platythorax]|uniref:Uncharacterized protein n=1 Tax=Lasius platythorax TaxID=488582 RepID=A0AAV2MZ77_9HYME
MPTVLRVGHPENKSIITNMMMEQNTKKNLQFQGDQILQEPAIAAGIVPAADSSLSYNGLTGVTPAGMPGHQATAEKSNNMTEEQVPVPPVQTESMMEIPSSFSFPFDKMPRSQEDQKKE